MTQIICDDMPGRIQIIQKYIACEARCLSPRTLPSLQTATVVIFVIKYRYLHTQKYIVSIFFFKHSNGIKMYFFPPIKTGVFSMPLRKAILSNKDFECGPFK